MSINKVILVGNVGKDPDVRYLDNNVTVANFTIATTERGYTGKDGQVYPDKTDWHNIVAWRGLAQIIEKYVKKGTQLYVEGKLKTRTYDDKDGIKRYVTEIYADNIQMLGRRPEATTNDETSYASQSQSVTTPTVVNQDLNNSMPEDFLGGDETDDLPF